MSNSAPYSSWSSHGRSHSLVERKPSDGDKFSGYAAPPQFVSVVSSLTIVDRFSFFLGSLYRSHVWWVRLGIGLVFLKFDGCYGRIDRPPSTFSTFQFFDQQAYVQQRPNSQYDVGQQRTDVDPKSKYLYLSCCFRTRELKFC